MTQQQNDFLKAAVVPAIDGQRKYGVPASITIAQAILESGWGQTGLARTARNYFGIKARTHAQPDSYEEFPTAEFFDGRRKTVMAKFARYPTPAAGFLAHAELLALSPRYRPAMAVCRDPFAFAQQLQACGYSTNPAYADSLIELVREFNLTQYDAPPDPATAAQQQEVA